MGLLNQRATCPNCGGKLHTRPRGLGYFTWMRSGPLVKTGTQCQWCGVALTGKVGWDNHAVVAGPAGAMDFEPSEREHAIAIAEARGPQLAELRDPLAPLPELPPETVLEVRRLRDRWADEDEECVRESERRAATELYGDPDKNGPKSGPECP